MPTTPDKPAHDHDHAEAFCLMRYESDDGRIVEYIWNSRDGVTPFIISAKDEKTSMTHVDWQRDQYRPDHQLQDGDRYFGEMTREAAERYAAIRVKQMDGTEYELQGAERTAMEASLVEHFLTDGCPDVIVFREPEPAAAT